VHDFAGWTADEIRTIAAPTLLVIGDRSGARRRAFVATSFPVSVLFAGCAPADGGGDVPSPTVPTPTVAVTTTRAVSTTVPMTTGVTMRGLQQLIALNLAVHDADNCRSDSGRVGRAVQGNGPK
jgi:hypothetical protein